MKYLIVVLTSFISFTASAQSNLGSGKEVANEVYSMIVANRYYDRGNATGSIHIYYPKMVAPILQKNNTEVSFTINLLNALNKHAEDGWSLVNVEVLDSKWNSFSIDSGVSTDTTLGKDETIYLFKKAK